MNTLTATQQVQQVQQLQQAGKLLEAESACREILLLNPSNAEVLAVLGVVLSQLGRHSEAIQALSTATVLSPTNFISFVNLGSVLAAAERFAEAERAFKKALSLNPMLPEGHYNLGNAIKDQGRLDEAVAAYRKATQLRGNYAAAWSNLGSAYVQQTKPVEAKAAINRALSLNPNLPSALNNFASILRNEGNLEASVQHSLRALTINPNYAEAYFTLGSALLASLDFKNALISYEKGAALKPNSKAALWELVSAYAHCQAHDGIVANLEKIISLDPRDAKALLYLGITQMERGYTAASVAAFEQSLAISQDPASQIRFALSVPPIVSSDAEILELRKNLNDRVAQLLNSTGVVADPFQAQIGANFFLAYHAKNNKELHSQISTLYRQYCPSLNFVAEHCDGSKKNRHKLRVGFISKYIYRHSVAISFAGVLTELSKDPSVELFLISTTDHSSVSVKEMYAGYNGSFVCIPTSLPYAQRAVSQLELDCLVYLDLGMDPLTFLLAFSRLAPVQAVMGGHPDTTGIDTVDYFLSSAPIESPVGDQHYSETLIRLNTPPFRFHRSTLPERLKTRADLGLPSTGHIYFCPMMLQKLHPDFDAAIEGILTLDPDAHVVLCESFQHARWGELIRERLDKVVQRKHRERVRFIPWIAESQDFLQAIALSDILIDPFHFGIGTTAAIAFSAGTPLVTLPGEFMRGRGGMMYCNLLNLPECIASTPGHYVELAVKLVNDKALNESVRQKIAANSEVLFRNDQSATELADLFKTLVDKSRQGSATFSV